MMFSTCGLQKRLNACTFCTNPLSNGPKPVIQKNAPLSAGDHMGPTDTHLVTSESMREIAE